MNRRRRKDLAHIVTLIVDAEKGGTPLGMAFLQYVSDVRKEARDAGFTQVAKMAREQSKIHEEHGTKHDAEWVRLNSHMHHDIANNHRSAATALYSFADACEALTKTPLDDTNV